MIPPECGATAPSFFATVAPLGSWVLVIVGWIVVNHGNNKREARKEMKAAVEAIIARSEKISDLAYDYFTAPPSPSNSRLAATIRSELKTLATELTNLRKASDKKICAEHALICLRQSVTSGKFDSADREPEDLDAEVFAEIDEAVMTLHRRLTTCFTTLPR